GQDLLVGELGSDFFQFRTVKIQAIEEVDDEPGLFNFVKGAFNTYFLDHIHSFPYPCRIDKPKADSLDAYMVLHGIPGGTRYLTDNGPFFVEQGIEQGG